MSTTVVTAKGLGKKYKIGGPTVRYKTIRESLVNTMKSPIQRLLAGSAGDAASSGDRDPNAASEIWALKDVSFEIRQGDVVGIIGANGAGKSTLLKILSRITDPTEGEVEIFGRVGSLLEVGTGFHPELNGRENIFLNGTILGMNKEEVRNKFDEIVAFAEIEKFLDTPVKHYSTGMGTRLAFAIAAHLEPEILVVDEVLAVGDMAFRKKCLGKMSDVSRKGRTVLFVSHEMNAIRHLCRSAILLDKGRIMAIGETGDVIRRYEASVFENDATYPCRAERKHRTFTPKYFSAASIAAPHSNSKALFRYGDVITLTIDMEGSAPQGLHFIEWNLYEKTGGSKIAWGSTVTQPSLSVDSNCSRITFDIGPLPLSAGTYAFSLAMGVARIMDLDNWSDAITFEIVECRPADNEYNYSVQSGPVFIPYSIEVAQ
jgi:lipopolysaccharide transport system ATP-binding protein